MKGAKTMSKFTNLFEDFFNVVSQDANLAFVGPAGSGKTIAARMYVSHLIQQGKKVVALDGLNELRQYSSLLGGESIEYDKIQQSQFNSLLTNILLFSAK